MKIMNLTTATPEEVESYLPFINFVSRKLGLVEEEWRILVTFKNIDGGRTFGRASVYEDLSSRVEIDYEKTFSRLGVYETIAHELTHVKQYLDKRLRPVDMVVSVWEGEVFSMKELHGEYTREKYKKYRALPWEIEARASARKLIIQYYMEKLFK